jgi:predicted glycoside hydrolase/deacetylase ChbG (UPF0249 family)
MANAPHAARALAEWKRLAGRRSSGALASASARAGLDDPRVSFDFGVHLNLTQGRPLTASSYPAQLLDRQGRFPGIARLFARLRKADGEFDAALGNELAAQIGFVVDHELRPGHVNGHQYIELLPAVSRLLPGLLTRFGIRAVRVAVEPALFSTVSGQLAPHRWLLALVKRRFARRLRVRLAGEGIVFAGRYFGTAHAGRVDEPAMRSFLRHAPVTGLIEIGLHPAVEAPDVPAIEARDGWTDPLARLRPHELNLLESPVLPALLRQRGLKLGRLSLLRAA